MKYRFILSFTLFFLSGNLLAQDKKTLGLQEAIDLGIKSSKQLKISQSKIDEATAALQEAMERKLPNASASASYLRLNSANIDLKSSNNNGNAGSNPNVNQVFYGMVNLSMPIYSGGKIRYGIRSAELLKKAIELDAEINKDEIIQNTIEAFANLFKAGSQVRLIRENLASARQRVKDLTNLEKNGLLARNDLLKAELQASTVELNLLDAENNRDFANLNMNLMLGLPSETLLALDTAGIEKAYDTRVMDDFIRAAMQNRKDKAATELRRQSAQTGVLSAKAEALPSIQLTGGYIAADIPNLLTVTNAVNIGLGVSYNIASLWKNKSKVKQAESRVQQIQYNEELLDDRIRLQVSRDYLTVISNRKKVEVYAKALEQATENERIVKNKFNNSLATTQELLDADVALLQSKLSFTLAKADQFVAYNKLLQSSGILAHELQK
ncbi:MAG: TolC family protein [Chitinophagaceae bacterium]|nr:TolC family protein [Chitinophagaceae bacterium]